MGNLLGCMKPVDDEPKISVTIKSNCCNKKNNRSVKIMMTESKYNELKKIIKNMDK